MITFSTHKKIVKQLEKQLRNFFIDIDFSGIENKIDEAYERSLVALSASTNKYLNPDGIVKFSLEHSGCWSVFLYYLSNCLKTDRGGQTKYII